MYRRNTDKFTKMMIDAELRVWNRELNFIDIEKVNRKKKKKRKVAKASRRQNRR